MKHVELRKLAAYALPDTENESVVLSIRTEANERWESIARRRRSLSWANCRPDHVVPAAAPVA